MDVSATAGEREDSGMKIDEASINHNVVRRIELIKNLDLWDMENETGNELRIMTLGYIQGVCGLADDLKKVLAE